MAVQKKCWREESELSAEMLDNWEESCVWFIFTISRTRGYRMKCWKIATMCQNKLKKLNHLINACSNDCFKHDWQPHMLPGTIVSIIFRLNIYFLDLDFHRFQSYHRCKHIWQNKECKFCMVRIVFKAASFKMQVTMQYYSRYKKSRVCLNRISKRMMVNSSDKVNAGRVPSIHIHNGVRWKTDCTIRTTTRSVFVYRESNSDTILSHGNKNHVKFTWRNLKNNHIIKRFALFPQQTSRILQLRVWG